MSIFTSGAAPRDQNGEALKPLPQESDRISISRQFCAMDVHNPLFESRLKDLARFYADVFNRVESVKHKWTDETAYNLLIDRMRRPGSLLALLDTYDDNKIVGAFFARIVPGRNGINLSEPDILIHPDEKYRRHGLGSELGYKGRQYASEICHNFYGNREHLKENHSQTYKHPDFPKSMWQRHGYTLRDLFVQNAESLLTRNAPGNIPKVILRIPRKNELDALADFMTDPKTVTSDGMKWKKTRALDFLHYMYRYNGAVMRIAENGNGITGLMVGDTIQRRTGSSLISLHGFISGKDKTAEAINSIASTLTYQVVTAANTISMHQTQQPVTEIEIATGAKGFFEGFLPNLEIDDTFMNMTGTHSKITSSLRPKNRRDRITLVGANPASGIA